MHYVDLADRLTQDYSQTGSVKEDNYKVKPNPFNPADYLDQVPLKDSTGFDMPQWKRAIIARQLAEKAYKDHLQKVKEDEEQEQFKELPPWKQALLKKAKENEKILPSSDNEKESKLEKPLTESLTISKQTEHSSETPTPSASAIATSSASATPTSSASAISTSSTTTIPANSSPTSPIDAVPTSSGDKVPTNKAVERQSSIGSSSTTSTKPKIALDEDGLPLPDPLPDIPLEDLYL